MADRIASRQNDHGRVTVLAASIAQASPLCDGKHAPCDANCVCWKAASMEAVKQSRAKLSEARHD